MLKFNKLEKSLYILFIISSIVYAVILIVNPELPLHFIIKIIPIICLLILTIIHSADNIKILLLSALVFSAAGDITLGIDIENLFILGLIFFLIAHIFYIILFFKGFKFNKKSIPINILILIYAVTIGLLLRNIENKYLIPVILYLLIITVMAVTASFYSTGNKYKTVYFVIIGAVLFMISDSIIAINKFLFEFPFSRPIGIITYYAAQFFIINGFILKDKTENLST